VVAAADSTSRSEDMAAMLAGECWQKQALPARCQ
jgi:hypothetical protein